jgi:hypothetical protein
MLNGWFQLISHPATKGDRCGITLETVSDHRAAQPQPKSGKLFNREWTPMNANESPLIF